MTILTDIANGVINSCFAGLLLICNPALAEKDPVFGQLSENKNKGKKPSYLMVKAGTWGEDACQLHRFFSLKDVKIHGKAPYKIKAGDCFASETALKGSISISKEEAESHPEWMCDHGEISFDLIIDKQIAFNVGYGASKPLRDVEAFAMYWHAEGMKSAYGGIITFNGRKYNSVFDIGGGRPKIYFVPLDRRLLGVFYYEGKEYDFNFSKLHLHVQTQFSFEEKEDEVIWHVRQENIVAAMKTEIHCLKKDMLLINYEAPDGQKLHNRLWNGGTGYGTVKLYDKKGGKMILVDEIEATHVGCEYGEYGMKDFSVEAKETVKRLVG